MAIESTVSVLMGVYNDETYLRESIDSILEQTYDEVEFIIVDDGSTDNSPDHIQSYDDRRLTLIKNESNQGLTVSLNRALEHADGKYIARQDADDVSDPRRLERQVAFLEAHEDVAVVGTGAKLIDGTGAVLDRRIGYCNPTYEDFLEKNRLVHGSILARRDILERLGGYDEFFRYSQDYELWLRLANEYRIANIPEPLYSLRLHDESVYFSRKDKSVLYSKFAHDLASGTVDAETEAEVREEGILQYWEHLDDSERASVHRELAVRYLRYGHREPALEECRNVRSEEGWSLGLLGLFALAHGGDKVTSLARWGMRRYLNLKTRVRNRFSCPYW